MQKPTPRSSTWGMQGLQADQLLRERSHPIGVTAAPTKVDPHVATNGPTKVRKRLSERREARRQRGIGFFGGEREQGWRHLDAERARRMQIDNELEFDRLHHRQLGGLLALEDASNIDAG